MNDIKKLHQVIGVLEEQASQVSEFSGVLSAVNDASRLIETSNTELRILVKEQKTLVSDSYQRFETFGDKLCDMEKLLADICQSQEKTLKAISDLEILSPMQFENGYKSTEKKLMERNNELYSKITAMDREQQASIKSLRITLVLGMLVLAGGIVFFG